MIPGRNKKVFTMNVRLLLGLFMAAMVAILSGCVGYSSHTLSKNKDGSWSENYSNRQVGVQIPNRAPIYSGGAVIRPSGQAYYPSGVVRPGAYPAGYQIPTRGPRVQVWYFRGDNRAYDRVMKADGTYEYHLHPTPVHPIESD